MRATEWSGMTDYRRPKRKKSRHRRRDYIPSPRKKEPVSEQPEILELSEPDFEEMFRIDDVISDED